MRAFILALVALAALAGQARAQVFTGNYLGGRVLSTDPTPPGTGRFKLYNKSDSIYYMLSDGVPVLVSPITPYTSQWTSEGTCTTTKASGAGVVSVCPLSLPASGTYALISAVVMWGYGGNVSAAQPAVCALYRSGGAWTQLSAGAAMAASDSTSVSYGTQAHGPTTCLATTSAGSVANVALTVAATPGAVATDVVTIYQVKVW